MLFLDKDEVVSNHRYEFKNTKEKINPIKNECDFIEERDIFDLINTDISDNSLEELKNKFELAKKKNRG